MAGMTRPLALSLALLAGALAGCLAPADPPVTVTVPAPRAGATYGYEGSDGSTLDVTVHGTATRLDRALAERSVVRLTWTLTTPDDPDREPSPTTFRFREHVDPATGRVLQQVADCGIRWDDPRLAGETRACYDERAIVIFAAAGLPGAFGAGPHWNRTLTDGEPAPVPIRPLGLGDPQVAYTTAATTVGDRSCVELDADAADTGVSSGLHWTVVEGPTVLCPGLALPARFTGWDGRTYRLVDHEAGGAPLDVGGEVPPPSTGLLADRAWSAPFLVADPTSPAEFTVREAHRVALNRSDPYRGLWEDAEEPMVTGTFFMNDSGGGAVGAGTPAETEWNDQRRCVTVQDPSDGRTAEACINKDSGPQLPNSSPYSVEREETGTVDVTVDRSAIPDRQASLHAALQNAEAMMIEDEPMIWWAESYGVIASRWSPQRGTDIDRSDGYQLSVFFDDPPPPPEPRFVFTPYQFRFDGPTGTVEWLDLNRSHLPLIDAI